MKKTVRILMAAFLTFGVLTQTGCAANSSDKAPFVKIGDAKVELKGEFADSIKALYDNNCYVTEDYAATVYKEDGTGYNKELKPSDIDKSKPVVGVSRPKYVETEETMDFAYTTYDFMKSNFADKEVEVSFVNDVKLGDDAKTVSEKFGGKGMYSERVGFVGFVADGKPVDMEKYTKMAQDYLKTSFPASGAVYYNGRDDLSKEEAKAYAAYMDTYGILSAPFGQLSSLMVSFGSVGIAEENMEYLTAIYAPTFAAMDLSKQYTNKKIKSLYSLEVNLDGDVLCHVATRSKYMKEWEDGLWDGKESN